MTVVVAGASGFMGRRLVAERRAAGETVRTIGRRDADATWGDTAAITRVLDGADVLVNLAGRSVNCRYTPANRAEILRSRVETTGELAGAVAAAAAPPPLWLNSSTATIYRHAERTPQLAHERAVVARIRCGEVDHPVDLLVLAEERDRAEDVVQVHP